MKLTNKQIRKIGNSYYFPVPKTFVDEGVINPSSKYNISLDEADLENNTSQSENNEDYSNFL